MTAPEGSLGASGTAFWKSVHDAYELDPRDMPVLLEVCRVLDEIDKLSEALAAGGVLSTGSAGQVVEHPALAGLRAHRLTLDRLLVRLGLPDEAGQAPRTPAQTRARKAAQSRWRGHVPRGGSGSAAS